MNINSLALAGTLMLTTLISSNLVASNYTARETLLLGTVYENTPSDGWKYLPDLGWQYTIAGPTDAYYLWSPSLSWLYADAAFGSFIWSFEEAKWIDYGTYKNTGNYTADFSYQLLDGKTYTSVGNYDSGLGTNNAIVYDHWVVSFKRAQATWKRYDVVETASVYTAGEGVVFIVAGEQHIVKVNPLNGYILLDGKKYKER